MNRPHSRYGGCRSTAFASLGRSLLLLTGDQSSITFDSEMRHGILFEDRNFSNSKKYFWALQSLGLFAEHIEGTIRSIPNVLWSINLANPSPEDRDTMERTTKQYQERFGELRDRIERKRQEIQSLRDGVRQPIPESTSFACGEKLNE